MKWLIGTPKANNSYAHDYWFIACITEIHDTVYNRYLTSKFYFTSDQRKISTSGTSNSLHIHSLYWNVTIYDSYEELLTDHFDKLL